MEEVCCVILWEDYIKVYGKRIVKFLSSSLSGSCAYYVTVEANGTYNCCNVETVHRSFQQNSQRSINNHPSTQSYFSLMWILIECT